MKRNRIIRFDSKERILETARSYVESVETFFDESDRAIPLLLKAMKLADRDFKREIILLLGSFAKDAVVWPLYDLIHGEPSKTPPRPKFLFTQETLMSSG